MSNAVKINHVTIITQDKEKSVNFYSDILGLEKYQTGNSVWIRIGTQYIHISEEKEITIPQTFAHFAIEIEDLSSYLTDLDNKGLSVEVNNPENPNYSQYFIKDPDGNLIELIAKDNIFFNPKL